MSMFAEVVCEFVSAVPYLRRGRSAVHACFVDVPYSTVGCMFECISMFEYLCSEAELQAVAIVDSVHNILIEGVGLDVLVIPCTILVSVESCLEFHTEGLSGFFVTEHHINGSGSISCGPHDGDLACNESEVPVPHCIEYLLSVGVYDTE